jgi:enoyl-CoA hydratase/carnithine racemase
MPEPARLITTRVGRVLTVRFNNPPRHFFDERMGVEFDELTGRLRRDRTVRVVMFTGQDDSFLTHFDVGTLLDGARTVPFRVPYPLARAVTAAGGLAARVLPADSLPPRTAVRQVILAAQISTALTRLTRMDKVTVAAINGLALGMGCVFALACDIRLMAEEKQIGLPESALGMLAAAGGTQRLVRTVGAGRALDLLLDGRWLTASEAVGIGLVHRAVPADRLRAEAAGIAHRLAGRSPVAVREIKRMVNDASTRPAGRGLAMEAASLVTTLTGGQAEPRLAAYRDWLGEHPDLSDEVIRRGWLPFLTTAVEEAPR